MNKKTIVLCIRGTLSAKDVLTDLCCTAEEFLSHEEETLLTQEEKGNESEAKMFQKSVRSKYNYRAHQGMVNAARAVSKMTYDMIKSELDKDPEYKLVLVGHSLGKKKFSKARSSCIIEFFDRFIGNFQILLSPFL